MDGETHGEPAALKLSAERTTANNAGKIGTRTHNCRPKKGLGCDSLSAAKQNKKIIHQRNKAPRAWKTEGKRSVQSAYEDAFEVDFSSAVYLRARYVCEFVM